MTLDPRLRSPEVDRLFSALLMLEDTDQCYRFFNDLCTVGEIKAMAQRLEVARLLSQGATYEEIVRSTGISTATISRIKRFLNWGADGYKMVIDRLRDAEDVSDQDTP